MSATISGNVSCRMRPIHAEHRSIEGLQTRKFTQIRTGSCLYNRTQYSNPSVSHILRLQ